MPDSQNADGTIFNYNGSFLTGNERVLRSKLHKVKVLVVICFIFLASCSSTSKSSIQTSKSAISTTIATNANYVPPLVTYNKSCEKSAVSQVEIDQCANSELAQVTEDLDVAITKASNLYGSANLNLTQVAWNKYMEAECALVARINTGEGGGTVQPFMYVSCQTELTVKRVQELDSDIYLWDH